MNDPLSGVRWIPADENPYGVDLLDCRSFSQSMVSTTQDPAVADSFLALRDSNGEQHRGRAPQDAVAWRCALGYPHHGELRDGPVYRAEAMEDKWDIYLHDDHLYFARSWTGVLEYRARLVVRGDGVDVIGVEARTTDVESDPPYAVAAVDFLIRSHIYRQPVPHPLPEDAGSDLFELTMFSFSKYGRRGLYGTFADTTRLMVREWAG